MAAISQNCCGETAASIWGDVSVCLSQHRSLQAFHCHVVRSWSAAQPPSLVLFQSRHPSLPPPPPAPPLAALSGHPSCLFRWNRRGNESQSPLLTPSWDFAAIVCTLLLCSCLCSLHQGGATMLPLSPPRRERRRVKAKNNLANNLRCTLGPKHSRISAVPEKADLDNCCGLVNVQLGLFMNV